MLQSLHFLMLCISGVVSDGADSVAEAEGSILQSLSRYTFIIFVLLVVLTTLWRVKDQSKFSMLLAMPEALLRL